MGYQYSLSRKHKALHNMNLASARVTYRFNGQQVAVRGHHPDLHLWRSSL